VLSTYFNFSKPLFHSSPPRLPLFFSRHPARPSAPSYRSFARSARLPALLLCSPACPSAPPPPMTRYGQRQDAPRPCSGARAPTSARSGEGELHHRREPSRARAAAARTLPCFAGHVTLALVGSCAPGGRAYLAGFGRPPLDLAVVTRPPLPPGRIWPPAAGSSLHPFFAPSIPHSSPPSHRAPPPTLPLP